MATQATNTPHARDPVPPRRDSPCATCHQQAPRYDTYTCYGCHEHSPAKIARKHLKEGIQDFTDCVRCHPTGREHEGGHD